MSCLYIFLHCEFSDFMKRQTTKMKVRYVTIDHAKIFLLQMILVHQTSVEFPAVTVCNQNRVSCKKLHENMLDQLSSSTNESLPLVLLYDLSHCGIGSIGCMKVGQMYYEYYGSRSEDIPAILYEKDPCLNCHIILRDFVNECTHREDELIIPSKYLEFLWQTGQCNEKIKSEKLTKLMDIVELLNRSLESCPEWIDHHFDLAVGVTDMQSPITSSTEKHKSFLPLLSVDKTKDSSSPVATRVKRQMPETPPDDELEHFEASIHYDFMMKFLSMYMGVSNQMKRNIGYDFEDLIKDCEFMGHKCYNER